MGKFILRKTTLTILATMISIVAFSQEDELAFKLDSIEKTFTYTHGTVPLRNGVGQIVIPEGFKYLEPQQAERVLVDLWGNPKSTNLTLGLILPEDQKIISDTGYVFNIQYDEIGYVKDDDADDINYEDLLKEMQGDAEEENKERQKEGYDPISIVGWGTTPFYDKERKILHWAKEIKFGNQEVNTLNYNVRVLGRKGVLILNAISTMPNLPLVQKDIHKVLDIVQFNDGYKYGDFDASIDQVAAWTIGGLVAGKVLAKIGFFALFLKFWKIILFAVIGFFGTFWKKITGKKKKEQEQDSNPAPIEPSEDVPPVSENQG